MGGSSAGGASASVIQHVLDMREKLESFSLLVMENAVETQISQKHWDDKHA